MTLIAVQYLEESPELLEIPARAVRERLNQAFQRLPFSTVLVGWCMPPALFEACAEEASRLGIRLFRWHPLLTGAGDFPPEPGWRAVGLDGKPVAGFRGLPEFTFLCPNRSGARQAVLSHLEEALYGPYQGVFLDRIRYPSPAGDPAAHLACFCAGCRQAAADEGLDLEAVRRQLGVWLTSPEGALSLVSSLFQRPQGYPEVPAPDDVTSLLAAWLDFRQRTITRIVTEAASLARHKGLAVGLDCFSPGLACMVGQDMGALDRTCDWIKVMTYGHTWGPAGIPYEVGGLAGWLETHTGLGEAQALELVASAVYGAVALGSGLPLPASLEALRRQGLPAQALAEQVRQGRARCVRTLLAGVELVEIEEVVHLDDAQIRRDLEAFKSAGVDGLVLSWDLWHIPLKRLDLVREAWLG